METEEHTKKIKVKDISKGEEPCATILLSRGSEKPPYVDFWVNDPQATAVMSICNGSLAGKDFRYVPERSQKLTNNLLQRGIDLETADIETIQEAVHEQEVGRRTQDLTKLFQEVSDQIPKPVFRSELKKNVLGFTGNPYEFSYLLRDEINEGIFVPPKAYRSSLNNLHCLEGSLGVSFMGGLTEKTIRELTKEYSKKSFYHLGKKVLESTKRSTKRDQLIVQVPLAVSKLMDTYGDFIPQADIYNLISGDEDYGSLIDQDSFDEIVEEGRKKKTS